MNTLTMTSDLWEMLYLYCIYIGHIYTTWLSTLPNVRLAFPYHIQSGVSGVA
jgi:hypothetical protein